MSIDRILLDADTVMEMESAEQIIEFLAEQTRPLMPELPGKQRN